MRESFQRPVDELQPLAGSPVVPELAIRSGALVDEACFKQQMNWSAVDLAAAIDAKGIFSVDVDGARYFPAFFAEAGNDRRRYEAVARLLKALPSGSKWQFFVTGKGSLGGRSPVQALRLRQYSLVKVAATGFAER